MVESFGIVGGGCLKLKCNETPSFGGNVLFVYYHHILFSVLGGLGLPSVTLGGKKLKKMGKNNQNFEWVFINYAPNTSYICKKNGFVVMNIDGSGVAIKFKDDAFVELVKDKKVKERVLAILN